MPSESTYHYTPSSSPSPLVERADPFAPKNGGAWDALLATHWQWTKLLASEHGPPAYTTRLVLLVIALHMRDSNIAFPSQALIAERTGLKLRTVKLAIAVARRAGWLFAAAVVKTGHARGWRGNEYIATIPGHLAKHIDGFDPRTNRPLDRGAYGAPPLPQPTDEVVHMTDRGGAYDGIDVVHHMPPESSSENLLRESSEGRAPKNGGAPDAPPRAPQTKNPDELITRVSEQTSKEAVRQMARTAMARPVMGPIGGGAWRKPITDVELAEKVSKLRSAGLDEGTIRRQFATQASEPQLQRVLKKAS